MPLLSIIIPAFNAETSISRCLASCLGQTVNNLEVIVIDDGSSDRTSEIVLKIKDTRVTLLKHDENRGQSAARNTGIAIARGEYIGFVDADDSIEPDFYEKLKNGLELKNTDMAMSSMRIIDERVKEYTPQATCHYQFDRKLSALHNGSACDKLFRSRLIKDYNLTFLEQHVWEDNLFVIQAIWFSNGLQLVPEAIYNYITNPYSTTQSNNNASKRAQDSLVIAEKILTFLKEQGASSEVIQLAAEFIIRHMVHFPSRNGLNYYKEIKRLLGVNSLLKRKRNRYIKKKIFNLLCSTFHALRSPLQ